MERLTPPNPDGKAAERFTSYATVHFSAKLEDGTLLQDTRTSGEGAFELNVGAKNEACLGWDLALPCMKTGEKVRLICKPFYAFGEKGEPPLIPPNATVHFEIELLSVRNLMDSNHDGPPLTEEDIQQLGQFSQPPISALQDERPPPGPPEAEVPGDMTERAQKTLPMSEWFEDPHESSKSKESSSSEIIDLTESNRESTAGDLAAGNSARVQDVVPPESRYWKPDATRVMFEHHDGYTWRETDPEIEVTIPLPTDASNRDDVRVDIGIRTIHVSVLGKKLIEGDLVGELLKDESSWSFQPPEGGKPAELQLDLMKKAPATGEQPLWGYILAEEKWDVPEDWQTAAIDAA